MQDLIADLNGVKDLQNMLSDDNTRLNDNYKNLMEKMKNLEEIQNNYVCGIKLTSFVFCCRVRHEFLFLLCLRRQKMKLARSHETLKT